VVILIYVQNSNSLLNTQACWDILSDPYSTPTK
jgi:hypothetical protein